MGSSHPAGDLASREGILFREWPALDPRQPCVSGGFVRELQRL